MMLSVGSGNTRMTIRVENFGGLGIKSLNEVLGRSDGVGLEDEEMR
jgi:hypothetical protein